MVGPRALAQQRSAFGHNILCHKLLEMGGLANGGFRGKSARIGEL